MFLGLWAQRLTVMGLAAAAPALGQEIPGPEPTPVPSPAPPDRGLARVGPFWLTPYLSIGQMGYDSNILLTPEGREGDFTASGGPGLRALLPFAGFYKLEVDGRFDYLYFARNPDQRRLNASGRAVLERATLSSRFAVSETYQSTNSRIGFEVDARIPRSQERTELEVRFPLLGRLSLSVGALRGAERVEGDSEFLGNDVSSGLERDARRGRGELEFAITALTSLFAGGEFTRYEYLRDPSRDADVIRAAGGLQTKPEALIPGRIAVGAIEYRFVRAADRSATRRSVYLDVRLDFPVSPRTGLVLSYNRELDNSVFNVQAGTPTILREFYGVELRKELSAKIDVELRGRRTKLLTDGKITIEPDGPGPATGVRDDVIDDYWASLGYRPRERLRISIDGQYIDRRSSLSYFRVQGLQAGFAVKYDP